MKRKRYIAIIEFNDSDEGAFEDGSDVATWLQCSLGVDFEDMDITVYESVKDFILDAAEGVIPGCSPLEILSECAE